MPTATLVSNAPAGTDLRLLTFDHVPDGYTVPGQFVTAAVGDGKPAFFAIASSPGQPVQFLIKRSGEMAERCCSMKSGEPIELSDVMGKGFPMAATEGRELTILVNGSGISAARPVIQAELAGGLKRAVNLIYGVMTPGHRAFLADLEAWANAGVSVHTVIDPAGSPDWTGPTGYVQDWAKAHGLIRADAAVVLVGLPIMLDLAKAMCADAGMPDDCVITNF